MGRLLAELTHPQQQIPSLILFISNKTKNLALREIFPCNNIKRGHQDGIVNLRLDTTTLDSDHPILFADSDPEYKPTLEAPRSTCHETRSYQLQYHLHQNVNSFIHAHLSCLFSDVVCLFAEEFASLDDAVEQLRCWAVAGGESMAVDQVRPSVILVFTGDDASSTYNLLEAQDLRFNLRQRDLIDFFSSITVLRLAGAQISPLARYRRLKEALWRHADEMRTLRQTQRTLFSAYHLTRFMEEAVKQIIEEPSVPFSFLLTSRLQNSVSQDYCERLTEFLQLSTPAMEPEDALTIIGSSVFMDAYPPDMHCKFRSPKFRQCAKICPAVFSPGLVYDVIYQPHCLEALKSFTAAQDSIETRSKCVRDQVTSMFDIMVGRGWRAADLHLQSLRRLSGRWPDIKSNRICLACLNRKAEGPELSCGHALCDVCVRLFGSRVAGFA